jgi:hypothetical protein
MAPYGIVIDIPHPQLTLTLLANIKTATKSDYGCEFCSAMHAIRKKYMYNHMHDTTLLQIILKERTGANSIRVLKDAPAPGTGTVHLVAESVSYLQAMMGEDTDSMYTELAYNVSSNSNLSGEERKPCACEYKKSQRSNLQGTAENRRRTRTTSQRRIRASTARSSIARSPFKLNWTSACGTRNTRANALNQSATSSKWHSSLGGYASKDNESGDD